MLIAGPSSSGKTTFAHRLTIALRVHGLQAGEAVPGRLLSRPRRPSAASRTATPDLERLDTLDADLL